ncbi:MAG: sigma-54-dependent Fis family transcriptional regulator [Planctomycetes bacterium]|nr:sigma-54-dependent Fis family transcriptional regulator [Planctomycetota bacterium]MBI3843309.1 sigma-54-dependent Fis family transcriptional regulator [Planctomycetota bacterium]
MTNSRVSILVVDDEPGVCWALREFLEGEGHDVRVASDAAQAEAFTAERAPALVFLDVRLPGETGIDALPRLRERAPNAAFVVMTAYGSMETAIDAIRRGAHDYVTKPLDLDRVKALVDRIVRPGPVDSEVRRLREAVGASSSRLVGTSPSMQEVYKRIGALSRSAVPVLVTGESGTGKELVARALHDFSARSTRPFEPINCAAVPEGLLESELFGFEKGAFTGADRRREGKFERADGGTVFLDEIAEMPSPLQAKLLRFLEDGVVERLGGSERRKVDVRILAATNQDLDARRASGAFRSDLFFRLRVGEIRLPALRERAEDLPLIVAHVLEEARCDKEIARETLEMLQGYPWPGNVRELRNVLLQAQALAAGRFILPEHLPAHVRGFTADASSATIREFVDAFLKSSGDAASYERFLEAVERPLFARVLQETHGNRALAAERLGLHRTTLRKKLRKYGLERGTKSPDSTR